jgi:hypothetical protein
MASTEKNWVELKRNLEALAIALHGQISIHVDWNGLKSLHFPFCMSLETIFTTIYPEYKVNVCLTRSVINLKVLINVSARRENYQLKGIFAEKGSKNPKIQMLCKYYLLSIAFICDRHRSPNAEAANNNSSLDKRTIQGKDRHEITCFND